MGYRCLHVYHVGVCVAIVCLRILIPYANLLSAPLQDIVGWYMYIAFGAATACLAVLVSIAR